MLYYVHQAQVLLFAATVYLMRRAFGDVTLKPMCYAAAGIAVAFHASMLYLTVSPIVYLWFAMVMWHFYLHLKVAYYTIPETKKATIDEIWHAANQCLATYYLWSHGMMYQYYAALMIPYFVFLYLAFAKNEMRPVYYLGSPMEALFVISLRGSDSFVSLLPAMALHLFVTHLITYSNKPGRGFLRANIAGCTFLSEFLILYLTENGIY